ncbi:MULTISPECIES: hypothetical protein [unclassified Mucilaginibacter]|uniref:hypothetical protein n=1 Tax=unclassified Mucilaginibacter TaxID=2617802 RepID=UPI0031F62E45
MKKLILLIGYALLFAGCGGGKDVPEAVLPPGKAALLFPAKDELCTQGTVLSPTQSAITFKWNAADHATSYEVSVKNLLTQTLTSQSTTATSLALTLQRNTPYSWTVISRSSQSDSIRRSDSWKFYNAGPGTTNYAPFPAELLIPALGQTVVASNGKIKLDWSGNDVDGDIVNYDVYLGTKSDPAVWVKDIKDSELNSIDVVSGQRYFWKIVSHDASGNTSYSDIFQFTVR